MTAGPLDFKRVRGALALLVFALLAGAVPVGLTFSQLQQARSAVKLADARLAETENRLARVADEERELRAAIERYRRIEARGLIGQEERLDWVEEIARLKAGRKLLALEYEIQPQAPAGIELMPAGASAGPYQVMGSRMRLSMSLLHEDDLLGFLDDLQDRVHALLYVRRCSIDRRTGSKLTNGMTPQLSAECEIDWITLKEKR